MIVGQLAVWRVQQLQAFEVAGEAVEDALVAAALGRRGVDADGQHKHVVDPHRPHHGLAPLLPEHTFAPPIGLQRQHRHEVVAPLDRLVDAVAPIVTGHQLALVEPDIAIADGQQCVGNAPGGVTVLAGVADEDRWAGARGPRCAGSDLDGQVRCPGLRRFRLDHGFEFGDELGRRPGEDGRVGVEAGQKAIQAWVLRVGGKELHLLVLRRQPRAVGQAQEAAPQPIGQVAAQQQQVALAQLTQQVRRAALAVGLELVEVLERVLFMDRQPGAGGRSAEREKDTRCACPCRRHVHALRAVGIGCIGADLDRVGAEHRLQRLDQQIVGRQADEQVKAAELGQPLQPGRCGDAGGGLFDDGRDRAPYPLGADVAVVGQHLGDGAVQQPGAALAIGCGLGQHAAIGRQQLVDHELVERQRPTCAIGCGRLHRHHLRADHRHDATSAQRFGQALAAGEQSVHGQCVGVGCLPGSVRRSAQGNVTTAWRRGHAC